MANNTITIVGPVSLYICFANVTNTCLRKLYVYKNKFNLLLWHVLQYIKKVSVNRILMNIPTHVACIVENITFSGG